MALMPIMPFGAGLGDPWPTLFDPFINVAVVPVNTWPTGGLETMLVQPVDVEEHADSFDICTDVPGMSPEDISLEFNNSGQLLTINGRTMVREEGGFTRSERTRHSFSRSFTLPGNAMPDDITANIENGVLNVHVPKRQADKAGKEARRIPIQQAPGKAQIGGAPERKEAAACAKPQARVGGAGDAGTTPTTPIMGTT